MLICTGKFIQGTFQSFHRTHSNLRGRIMMQTDTVISVTGLEKSYKNLKVLENINLSVKRGSVVAVWIWL